jgi:hypothetical protein
MDLLITMPLYDGRMHHACVAGVLQTIVKYGAAKVSLAARQGSFLPRLRDLLTSDFLKSGAEFMLCVDADIAWTVNDLDALWSRLREFTLDREMIAGLYPKKSLRDTRPVAALLENERNGLREAACVGGGFLLVHRKGIERMVDKFKDLAYPSDAGNPDQGMSVGLWSPFCAVKGAQGKSIYLGEDFSFCQRWREMGGKIWVDPNVRLGHVGECLYQMGVSQ